jgi:gamma-glutamylcyclotransferase (GGCT)/AIG2-like uncharacterized protein YtfP
LRRRTALPATDDVAILDDEPCFLFAYGTLTPDGPEAEARGGWSADSVRGRLFDLGPSPTLVDLGDPTVGWVDGFVRPVEESELRDRLDPYEGVEEGLYRRSVAVTRSGRAAWVYVYARPLPREARGPLARWDGLRGVLGPGVARENLEDGLHDRPGIQPVP